MKQEIIYTEYYALIVSDEKMKKGDFNVPSDFDRTSDISITSEEDLEVVNDRFNGYKKVIAHKPLTDAPILKGVPLLPEFSKEEDVEEIASTLFRNKIDNLEEIHSDYILGFQEGHRKAKETYKYTEEDLINLVQKGHEIYNEGLGVATDAKKQKLIDFIQSLQQPKRPKYFEYETIYRVKSGTIQEHKDGLAGFEYHEPKTIINAQGQTELIGDYIYEKDFTPNEEIFSQFKK
jgi:hypothetical protein